MHTFKYALNEAYVNDYGNIIFRRFWDVVLEMCDTNKWSDRIASQEVDQTIGEKGIYSKF